MMPFGTLKDSARKIIGIEKLAFNTGRGHKVNDRLKSSIDSSNTSGEKSGARSLTGSTRTSPVRTLVGRVDSGRPSSIRCSSDGISSRKNITVNHGAVQEKNYKVAAKPGGRDKLPTASKFSYAGKVIVEESVSSKVADTLTLLERDTENVRD